MLKKTSFSFFHYSYSLVLQWLQHFFLSHTCTIIMYESTIHYTHVFVCTILCFCVVSEDTHSLDMTFRENEDRGFYTETFHSSAWIYQGSDVCSGAIPPSPNNRTRAVSSKQHMLTKKMALLLFEVHAEATLTSAYTKHFSLLFSSGEDCQNHQRDRGISLGLSNTVF